MDIVTLGAAKAQTEKYVSTHFVNGANITITDNADGTQTIAASGEVSSEDTVARGEIADHVADKTNPHEVTAAQVGLGNVDNTSDANKPVSTATQAALDLKANTSSLATVATTGAYSDLSGTPTIPTVNNSTITIQKNGATVDSFTTNASSAKSINITVPTTASEVGALADTVKYAGASSAGGSATSAVKLDNAADAGSLTQPIFFESGKPKATTYSLAKSVPSNAVFTDTTYSFEGTYDASTNKAATMADIKDGKLTGYAQMSGDIAATDKVVEAIGKVEKKADDNKTNILSAYGGIVGKNKLEYDLSYLKSINTVGTWNNNIYVRGDVTYTVNNDNTITVESTGTSGGIFFLHGAFANTFGGDILSGTPSGGGNNTYHINVEQAAGSYTLLAQDKGETATIPNNTVQNIVIYINCKIATQSPQTFSPMICTQADYTVSSAYQPYIYDNVTLSNLIRQLQS